MCARVTEVSRSAPPQKQAAGFSIADTVDWVDRAPIWMLSGCRWRASGGAQRPVALSRRWAQAGYPVIYHNSRRHRGKGTEWFGGPLAISSDRLDAEFLRQLRSCDEGVLVSALPTKQFLGLMQKANGAGWVTVYDCIDDWEAFAQTNHLAIWSRDLEIEVANTADIVTASAQILAEKMDYWTGGDAVLVRNAGPDAPFADCERPADMPESEAGTAVYCGYLQGCWFDWGLLETTALHLPDVAFVIVGSTTGVEDRISKLPRNVHFIGQRPYKRAMEYVRSADVGLIPFCDLGISEAVDPIKYYDYVAAGIRTVATDELRDLHGRELVLVADEGADTLAPQVQEALQEPKPSRIAVQRLVAENTWTQRAKKMLDAIEKHRRDRKWTY